MCYDLIMVVIEIEDRVAAALRAQANVRDLSLDAFLQRIAETGTPLNTTPAWALADIERTLDELSTESPVLPDSFSRAEICAEHD